MYQLAGAVPGFSLLMGPQSGPFPLTGTPAGDNSQVPFYSATSPVMCVMFSKADDVILQHFYQ